MSTNSRSWRVRYISFLHRVLQELEWIFLTLVCLSSPPRRDVRRDALFFVGLEESSERYSSITFPVYIWIICAILTLFHLWLILSGFPSFFIICLLCLRITFTFPSSVPRLDLKNSPALVTQFCSIYSSFCSPSSLTSTSFPTLSDILWEGKFYHHSSFP